MSKKFLVEHNRRCVQAIFDDGKIHMPYRRLRRWDEFGNVMETAAEVVRLYDSVFERRRVFCRKASKWRAGCHCRMHFRAMHAMFWPSTMRISHLVYRSRKKPPDWRLIDAGEMFHERKQCPLQFSGWSLEEPTMTIFSTGKDYQAYECFGRPLRSSLVLPEGRGWCG